MARICKLKGWRGRRPDRPAISAILGAFHDERPMPKHGMESSRDSARDELRERSYITTCALHLEPKCAVSLAGSRFANGRVTIALARL